MFLNLLNFNEFNANPTHLVFGVFQCTERQLIKPLGAIDS